MSALAPVVVLSALLAGCGSSATSGGNSSSSSKINTTGTISEGYTLPPTTLDPEVGTSGADYIYIEQIYGNLIEINGAGNLIPAMATRWAFSGTGAKRDDTFTIWLRPGLKFSDGTPLNAAAVVSDWKRYLASGDVLDDLEYVIPSSIHAIGNDEVQVQTTQPNAQLPWGLADRAGMIIDPTAFTKDGAANFATHPVGAGPYKVTSVTAGHSYCYTRNDSYYLSNAADPRIQNLCIEDYANTTAEDTALRSGTVQVGIYLQGNDYKVLEPDSSLNVLHGPSLGFDEIYFNGLSRPSAHGANLVSAKIRLAYPGLGYNLTDPVMIASEAGIGIDMNVVEGPVTDVVGYYTELLAYHDSHTSCSGIWHGQPGGKSPLP